MPRVTLNPYLRHSPQNMPSTTSFSKSTHTTVATYAESDPFSDVTNLQR